MVDFWESDDHWDEDDTYKFLNAMIPFIEGGSASYSGEEDCNWRYSFDPKEGKWIDENGTIYYNDAEMIEALERKGFKVTVAEKA